ncbi:sensor domain-containing diguanylate cyclase [Pseudomonas sp. 148P]|uniref:diguanylate cyclase n=1 Tax=Pseudomonas ulcerans TaxID=3115852 RepID=A0ABU7HT51_9PSED|nr:MULTISPECIES: sensor domain-containing diguanylate cyclase [unclassified Pseudomonas]MEE1924931.1 sensor domain-containing diguanylate cyclase [Pseudomonas sp. 147P]MEE1934704.1 sensor domain-containing diguanylate cyclase [Pseudomonas sp. 148P]
MTFKHIDLRKIILLFALVTAGVTLANSFYAARKVQHQVLVDNALEANRAYAAKVASSIEAFLLSAQQQLAYSVGQMSRDFDNPRLLHAEARRIQEQDQGFNAITIVDATGHVLAAWPPSLLHDGQALTSSGAEHALDSRLPLISDAYTSSTGNLVVFVSHPVFDAQQRYLGFVGGAVYLREKGILHTLISNHFYRDGTLSYVVDNNRRLLYHPQFDRVGSVVGKNLAVDAVLAGESGAMPVTNSQGTDMLAGYADIPLTHWGVVSQKPYRDTVAPLDGLMWQMLRGTAPVGLLGLVGIWWMTLLITRPLRQLADNTNAMNAGSSPERIRRVRAWYFEADHIKRALLRGINVMQERMGRLNLQAQTDPLTGLFNRRALDEALEVMAERAQPFAVIALDIDHFKSINDNHGHDVGDEVLARLAGVLRECSREGDLAFRLGGEEFLLLLPDTPIGAASEMAERLRWQVQATRMEPVGHVTVSLGVARCAEGADAARALKQADELMYAAKQGGRNRVVAQPD